MNPFSVFLATHKKELTLVVVLIAIAFIYIYIYFNLSSLDQSPVINPPQEVTTSVETTTEPKKTEFGTTVPEDFPTNIPLPEGVAMTQSYSLEYPDQKQLTAVFVSQATVKQNYDLYKNFLEKENWILTNTHESESISSLYGTKDNSDMNITITASETEPTTSSNVSISVLKK